MSDQSTEMAYLLLKRHQAEDSFAILLPGWSKIDDLVVELRAAWLRSVSKRLQA